MIKRFFSIIGNNPILSIPIGICFIFGAFAFVAMLSLFVYLTGVNLFFPTVIGSIESCGCFGELIHFTPLSSFIKSVILLLIAIANLYIVYQKIYIKKTER